jgi:cysteine desulfurase family protein
VYAAVQRAMRELGAPAGRSAYAEAAEVEQAILNVRKDIAGLIGTDDPRRIVFTLNGTDALNIAIHGVLQAAGGSLKPELQRTPGPQHVVTTVAEHNSVLRPLRALEDAGAIEVTRVSCGADGIVDPADVRAALRPTTRLIAMTHASNVTGAIQPAADVGAIARQHGALFLLDAAQTLGDLPLDAQALGVDLLAAPGHKGLLGPLGTGVLYVRPGVEGQVRSVRQGGTGSRSDEDRQPDFLPDKFEPGNLNVPGIFGLGASVAYLRGAGVGLQASGFRGQPSTGRSLTSEVRALTARLIDGVSAIAGVTIYGPRRADQRVAIVSMNIHGFDPQEVAASLDAARRVQVRSGIHCAPRMHEALGTLATGGTVRLSIGPFNTAEDIDAAVEAVGALAATGV